MAKTKNTPLQKAVQAVTESHTPEQKMETLMQAFNLFCLETKRLEEAYRDLKERFESVNLEVVEANQKLKGKVEQLDFISFYLNSILSNISQGILFLDLNGMVTTYNAAAESILGVDSKKVLFETFWQNFEDDQFGFSMREAISDKQAPKTTFATVKGDNHTQRVLKIDTTFVIKENTPETDIDQEYRTALNTTQGLIVLIRDISEIRRLESVAARNDRMKELGEMASMVAHEIRNPLGGIKGFASLLQRDLKDLPHLEQLAAYIVEGTDNLNNLVSNVMDYSRPVQLKQEPTDLVSLMKETILHLNADESIDPHIELQFRSEQETLIACVDPRRLKSTILNLASNAIQAMQGGGELRIELETEITDAVIKVFDTGTGIPQENLEKIFSPFFTTRPDGHGFGLSEVYKIVQAHGGQIEVESEEGKGSIFTIRLPIGRVIE